VSDDVRGGVLGELRAREPIFHRSELGTSRGDFEAQTVEDYWEIGASGRRYDREFVWSVLERRYAEGAADVWETDEFECREVGAGTYLVTYRLRQGVRVTRRATVWRRSETGWRAVYHQGTVVAG
jgi:hypothetical protein